MWQYTYSDELQHYGVKGQKWGVRRYQDYNGRLKRGHEKRYGEWPPKGSSGKTYSSREQKKAYKEIKKYSGPRNNWFNAKSTKSKALKDAIDFGKPIAINHLQENGITYDEYLKRMERVSNEILGKFKDKPVVKVPSGKMNTAKEILPSLIESIAIDELYPLEIYDPTH